MEKLDKEYLDKSITYQEYRTLAQELYDKNTTTNGDDSEEILEYTRLNLHRMKRLDKTTKLLEDVEEKLQNLEDSWYWVVLTESWCGDAAQIIPIINKMAEKAGDDVHLRFLLRDQNPELMDEFLTNGSKAIPKLICIKQTDRTIVGSWGARPEDAQKLVIDYKENPRGRDFNTFAEQLHGWYAKDRTQSTQREITELIQDWEKM